MSGPAEYYESRHIVGFEETNVVGNAHHLRWQGRCRKMLLKEAPEVPADLLLLPLPVACEFFACPSSDARGTEPPRMAPLPYAEVPQLVGGLR